MKVVRSFKFAIRPSRTQAAALDAMLGDCCALYNAALEQRITAYRRCGVSLNYSKQCAELKAVRSDDPDFARWGFTTLQQVLRRLDKTFSAFFKRGKGFPRFRSRARFDSLDMRLSDGLTIRKTGRIRVVGVPGEIKVRWHRAMPDGAKVSHAVLSRKSGKWFICFRVEWDEAVAVHPGLTVGIDLGLNSLIATSEGEAIAAPRFARTASSKLRRHQRALARCKKGSKRRIKAKKRLAVASARIANQRRDFAHKLTRSLVDRFSLIAFENLNLNGLRRGKMARSVHDAAWSQIIQFATYKAESAGGSVVLVNARGTSQTCPDCGDTKPKKLSERTHRCDCGCVLDRDVAAAKIVLQRAISGLETSLRTSSQRVAA